MKHVRRSLWTSSVSVSRLAWSSWSIWSGREQPKAHQNREGTGGKTSSSRTHNSASLKHARNVVRLETSTLERLIALTRNYFHKWVNPSNTQIPTAGVTGDRLACPVAEEELNSVAHNKQTVEVSPGLGLRFCLSCVISLLVLTAIVHSWVILACVLTGQFSSAHPCPLHRLRRATNWTNIYSKKKKNVNVKLTPFS